MEDAYWEEGCTYADQGAGVVHGRLCLDVLHDGDLCILLVGGAGAGAEERHDCGGGWLEGGKECVCRGGVYLTERQDSDG